MSFLQRIKDNCVNNESAIKYIKICLVAQQRIQSKTKTGAKIEAKELFGYVERHHIWPQCLCELNSEIIDIKNLVLLQYDEHVECHRLLCDMFINEDITNKMISAFSMVLCKSSSRNKPMSIEDRILSNTLRSRAQIGKVVAVNNITGITKTVSKIEFDTDENLIRYNKGKVYCKDKTSGEQFYVSQHEFNNNDNLVGSTFGIKRTQEQCNAVSLRSKGVQLSEAAKQNMRNTPILECPYCNVTGHVNGMKRWHFENCKQK